MSSKDILRFCEKTRICVILKNLHVFIKVNYISIVLENSEFAEDIFEPLDALVLQPTTSNEQQKNSGRFPFPLSVRGDFFFGVRYNHVCIYIYTYICLDSIGWCCFFLSLAGMFRTLPFSTRSIASKRTRPDKNSSFPLSWLLDSPWLQGDSFFCSGIDWSQRFFWSAMLCSLGFRDSFFVRIWSWRKS